MNLIEGLAIEPLFLYFHQGSLTMSSALVLAGHGSQVSPQTAGSVWRQVDRLRAMGVADEVTAAFWKEPPSFAQALDALVSDDAYVVPCFTAEGYFSKQVLPAEMQSAIAERTKCGKRTLLCKALSTNARLANSIEKRLKEAILARGLPAEEFAIAVLGHGTKRDPDSRAACLAFAERLRAYRLAAETTAAFLDDEPNISSIYSTVSRPLIFALPYFLASGSHATLDVPRALGLPAGLFRAVIEGREVEYLLPDDDDWMTEAAIELAAAAGFKPKQTVAGSVWNAFPAKGKETLWEHVSLAGSLSFGQLRLTPEVVGAGEAGVELGAPSDLRRHVREGTFFRPLPTSLDLPEGWFIRAGDADRLHSIVETVYPGAVADWAASRAGETRVRSSAETFGRQIGSFRELERLSVDHIRGLAARICGRCARSPQWTNAAASNDARGDATIPCFEPCNYWMTLAFRDLCSGDD